MNPLTNTDLVDHLKRSIELVLPEVTLVGAACVLFLLAAVNPSRFVSLFVALLGLVAAVAVACLPDAADKVTSLALTPIDPHGPADFVRTLALAAAGLYILVGWVDTRPGHSAEYYGCLLVLAAGVSLVVRVNDLVTLFLALEMISIPTYVLLYLPTTTKAGQEATMKYFLLSVVASAVTLFGFSYLYGLAGSTNLTVIVSALVGQAADGGLSLLAVIAMVLTLAGLCFRLTAVPFHFYAPDVFEGGPVGVVAQLAVVPKLAGLVALARLLGITADAGLPFDATHSLVPLILWVLAAISMSFGNVLALVQDNFRRMMAYSGVAHSGYMLIGLLSAGTMAGESGTAGWSAVLYYLVAYGFMTIGAFAVIASISRSERPIVSIDDLAGLGRSNPFAAGILAVCLLSMIGLPLTAGFAGKLSLFLAAFQTPLDTPLQYLPRILAVVAAVNAAVGAVYYLRVIGVLFLRTPLHPEPYRPAFLPLVAALLCGIGTLAFGIYPKPLQDLTNAAAMPSPAVDK